MKNFNKKWIYQKTVLITGASSGIGFSIAKTLVDKFDCKVIGIARNEQKLLAHAENLNNKNNFSYKIFDVNDVDAWKNLLLELEEKGIQVDVLINNAGFMLPFSKFEKYSDKEIDEIINTNFISIVKATKLFLPHLKKSKTPAIINVSSSAGLCAVVGESMYCATKFAVRGFTETLIQDYKKQIYIGGIYPGFIKTDILGRMATKDKENKLINKLMMPLDKATKKIIKSIVKRKKRTVFGFDGRSLGLLGRLFPNLAPSLVRKVLKTSKLELFDEVFKD